MPNIFETPFDKLKPLREQPPKVMDRIEAELRTPAWTFALGMAVATVILLGTIWATIETVRL